MGAAAWIGLGLLCWSAVAAALAPRVGRRLARASSSYPIVEQEAAHDGDVHPTR